MSFDVLLFHILELLAAIASSYYYMRTKDSKIRPFVWYLWVMVFVETFGMYGYLLLNNYDNEIFIWIKNSVICGNTWLYNLFSMLTILLFGLFYLRLLRNDFDQRLIKLSVLFYIVFTFIYFIVNNNFFIKSLPYNFMLETIVVFLLVMLYYKQLLRSDKILKFYNSPYFYISSGLLLWFVGVTPLFIFDTYLTEINQNFVAFRRMYLLIANILLYSCFTFGFLYTIQFKKL